IPCNLNALVSEVVRDMRGPGRYNLYMELGEHPFVLGDPVSLRRIVENLVTNAIESLESLPGNVTVTTALTGPEDERLRVTVTDTGKGMTEDQKSQVFNDFYTTKETGTGLGLSIVRRLVMDMDGKIQVESRVGQGSSFHVDLPAFNPDEELRGSSENGI
ncbi:MAG: HAMP domain-containing histidine kinase, partial [Bacteroidetes bacterium]|nr:HAMP domain-containing histidine kinase [Bacteroidota bacterium]